tara:strand:+ start:8 stop:673 length:666 start_codon:yes stop_codon:yes gene_type:complete
VEVELILLFSLATALLGCGNSEEVKWDMTGTTAGLSTASESKDGAEVRETAKTKAVAEAMKQSAIVERAIRQQLDKFEGKLTEADFEKVLKLDLNSTDITDAGLAELAHLKNLTRLDLDSTNITGQGLPELSGLGNLTHLGLNHCYDFTVTGFKEITKLQQLTILRMFFTNVTNENLKEVGRLGNLRFLNLMNTKFTDEGLKELFSLQKLIGAQLRGTQVT